MDTRHRVYYLVNLNQNHGICWWNTGYDNYGFIYRDNLKKLKQTVSSLKIRPCNEFDNGGVYYQMKISCKKDEEELLRKILDKLPKVNYVQLVRFP